MSQSLVEYPFVAFVGLGLLILPRPLGLPSSYQISGVVGYGLCCAWVIGRSHAAEAEIDSAELLDVKAQQEQAEILAGQQQLNAAAVGLQAQVAQSRYKTQAEIQALEAQAIGRIEQLKQQNEATVAERLNEGQARLLQFKQQLEVEHTQRSAVLDQRAAELRQLEADLKAQIEELNRQPTVEERLKQKTTDGLASLEAATRLKLAEVEGNAKILALQRKLGLVAGPQGEPTLADLQQGLLGLNQAVANLGKQQTISVGARSAASDSGFTDFAAEPSYVPSGAPQSIAHATDRDPTDFVIE